MPYAAALDAASACGPFRAMTSCFVVELPGIETDPTWCFPPLSWYPDPRGTYSQSYWTGTRPIIIHPAAVDASIASVVETRGHTGVGQRDSERLPVSGNDKNESGTGKTRGSTRDDPVSAGPIIRMPRAERIFRDSLHEN